MARLIRLAYVSRACFEVDSDSLSIDQNIKEILIKCRKNNHKSNISGVLYFSNGYFFQCLEGKESVVNELVENIKLDPRHTDFKVSFCKTIRRRYFGSWSMKYIPMSKEVTKMVSNLGYAAFNPTEFSEFDINLIVELLSRIEDGSPHDNEMREYHRLNMSLWAKVVQRFSL